MNVRSWLIVSADDDAGLQDASTCGADAVIIDVASTIMPHRKEAARQNATYFLEIHRRQIVESRRISKWVRISPLDGLKWRDDLLSVMPSAPDGIVLPQAAGPEHVQQLGAELYELEQRYGTPTGHTKIIPFASDTAIAALNIPRYVDASLPRLAGLMWRAESLSIALGASREFDHVGQRSDAFTFARAQTLLTACARGVVAIDTMYPHLNDPEGLQRAAESAKADGFSGMLAINARQVPVINRVFNPMSNEQVEAEMIASVFANQSSPAGAADEGAMGQPDIHETRRMLVAEETRRAGTLPRLRPT